MFTVQSEQDLLGYIQLRDQTINILILSIYHNCKNGLEMYGKLQQYLGEHPDLVSHHVEAMGDGTVHISTLLTLIAQVVAEVDALVVLRPELIE